ncbi:MAG TPA: inositol monophosphatase [candidate division Zixibacteria bacterium]|nr:inositol monophosphatase [candidate division Zixibacteria bacterium]
MSEISNRLEFAKFLALDAGEILLEHFGKRIDGNMKSEREVVTEADLRSEEFILKAIDEKFGEPVLSEEFNPETTSDGALWIVDPLDGTNNFAMGFPFFAVIIAFAVGGKTQLGVIYEPIRGELFWTDGESAFLGDERIFVSETARLGDCMCATGFPYLRETGRHSNLEKFVRAAMSVRGIRRAGSAGLDLAYTAAGRFDFYWEPGLKPWDIAAGELLVRCAGGRTSDLSGDRWELGVGEIFAANQKIYNKALTIISSG